MNGCSALTAAAGTRELEQPADEAAQAADNAAEEPAKPHRETTDRSS
jgi:hypothetical protein